MPQADYSTLFTDRKTPPHIITKDAQHNAAFVGAATVHGQNPVGEATAKSTTSSMTAFVAGGPVSGGNPVTPLPVR
jgi:hypothetical protein